MQLIYRGETYSVHPRVSAPLARCPVVNWRYRVAGVAYETAPVVLGKRRHPVINWRYQPAG
ncbi:MAG TPA: hypothetical protein V6C65_30750 [Allocoleopsis sp.]